METRHLCEVISRIPNGAKIRRWTLREDNQAHYHIIVHLTESPLYLELFWRPNALDQVERVGLFRLDLHGLLQDGYIRHDPVGSNGPEVRVRIVRATNGLFYIQTRRKNPRIQLPVTGEDRAA